MNLESRMAHRKLRDVSVNDVAQLVVNLRRAGLGEKSIALHLAVLSNMLRYALRQGLVASNVVAALDRDDKPSARKTEKTSLTESQVLDLLHFSSGQWALLFRVMAFTGLRAGEALGLRWKDVDLKQKLIRVRGQVQQPKGGPVYTERLKSESARRDVYACDALLKLLAEHKLASEHSDENSFVFAAADGSPLCQSNLNQMFNKARDKGGLDKSVTPHSLRHFYGSVLIEAGTPIASVSRQMGHSNISQTLNTYTHEVARLENAERIREVLEQKAAR